MANNEKQFDVAVVGASIAGCTTAILMSRAGLRVALIDKHSGADAYKRLCGHYIQASATPVIDRLGLAEPIEAAGGVRNCIDLHTRWGVVAAPEPPGRPPYGYSIRRAKLDPLIRRAAIESPGVDYLPEHTATALLNGDAGAVAGVEVEDRRRRRLRIGARLVVGADGRNSRIARLADSRESRAANERFCYMAYFTGVGLSGASRAKLWALDPDVAIVSPNDDDMTLLAAFLHKRRLPEFGGDRERALRDLFGGLPDGPDLTRAELAGKVVGYTDYEIARRETTPRAGVALVGDAALTCDPTMAIGCGWALQSAAWLADATAPALAAGTRVGPSLRRYRRTHHRNLIPHHRMLTADARARELNPVQRLLFSAGARDRRTARVLHRYSQRSLPPRRLLSPRTLARAAWVNRPAVMPRGTAAR